MNGLTCEDICDILDDYTIIYANLDAKGDVTLNTQYLRINPIYNQDVETLMHEFSHIWHEKYLEIHDLPEDIIEYRAQEKLKTIYTCLENYLQERTKTQVLEYEY